MVSELAGVISPSTSSFVPTLISPIGVGYRLKLRNAITLMRA
jgi:hypothetical protein